MTDGRKYFTLSFDDGVQQDKTITELLKKHGIKATFNLNSGMFGLDGSIEFSGTKSVRGLPKTADKTWDGGGIADLSRIPEDEIRDVYDGFEIATHALKHENLTVLSYDECSANLTADRDNLRKYSDNVIAGHAFPFGACNSTVEKALSDCGFLYARGVENTEGDGRGRFRVPDRRWNFRPTCRQTDGDIEELLDEFIALDAEDEDLMFYMWGHSYEIDFTVMKERKFLLTFERMLEKVSEADDIIICDNRTLF